MPLESDLLDDVDIEDFLGDANLDSEVADVTPHTDDANDSDDSESLPVGSFLKTAMASYGFPARYEDVEEAAKLAVLLKVCSAFSPIG